MIGRMLNIKNYCRQCIIDYNIFPSISNGRKKGVEFLESRDGLHIATRE